MVLTSLGSTPNVPANLHPTSRTLHAHAGSNPAFLVRGNSLVVRQSSTERSKTQNRFAPRVQVIFYFGTIDEFGRRISLGDRVRPLG